MDYVHKEPIYIKQRAPSDDFFIPSYNLRAPSRVDLLLWNISFTDDDCYVPIVLLTIPSHFSRIWPDEVEISQGLNFHEQHGGAIFETESAYPSKKWDNHVSAVVGVA